MKTYSVLFERFVNVNSPLDDSVSVGDLSQGYPVSVMFSTPNLIQVVVDSDDPTQLYWDFFEACELFLHRVALLGVSEVKRDMDEYNVELLQSLISPYSKEYHSAYSKLYTTFLRRVDLHLYTEEQLRRIIKMCRFGNTEEGKNAEQHTLEVLQSFRRKKSWKPNPEFWDDVLSLCYSHKLYNGKQIYSQGNTMTRVMMHLLFLDDNSLFVDKGVTKAVSGLKQMFLGNRLK